MSLRPVHVTIFNIVFAFFGIVLCYLAFSLVRAAAWTLLTHMGGIACIIAAALVLFVWKRSRKY